MGDFELFASLHPLWLWTGESAVVQKPRGEWDAHSGLDWQIRRFAGGTSASAVPSNSRIISQGDCAFFSRNHWKKRVEGKLEKRTAPHNGICLITFSVG